MKKQRFFFWQPSDMKRAAQALAFITVAALLTSAGFITPWGWPISLAGVVLTCFLLERYQASRWRLFLAGCVVYGYIFFGIVLNFMYHIRATDLIQDSWYAGVFLWFTYILMVGALGIGFVAAGLLFRILRVSMYNKSSLFVPGIWAVSEYLRSVFFSIFFLGEGGSIGPYWGFGSLGFLASETPLRFATRIVGLSGATVLIVLIAVVLFHVMRKRYKYVYLLCIPILCSISGWLLYMQPKDAPQITAAVTAIGDNVEGDEYKDSFNEQLRLQGDIDVTVLPEHSYYFTKSSDKNVSVQPPPNSWLYIDSDMVNEQNKIMYHNSRGEEVASTPKKFLIPGGEYVPYIYQVILRLSGAHALLYTFEQDRAVQKATHAEEVFSYRNTSYGAIACSGAIAPTLYADLTRKGAEVLVNSASVSTMGISGGYYHQADQMAAFIATANARPFLQSSRGGTSYILGADGVLWGEELTTESVAVTKQTITLGGARTVYTLLGEYLIAVWLVVMGLRLFRVIREGVR